MNFTINQLAFIQENFDSKTSKRLFEDLVSELDYNKGYTSYRTELYRIGYHKIIMVRWSKAETTFLKENYKTIGNVEIAKALSKNNRVFTKRQVQKKLQLLKITRTDEELENILERNKANGVYVLGAKKTWITRKLKIKNNEQNNTQALSPILGQSNSKKTLVAMKKQFKFKFDDWKVESRNFDLSKCFVSMNGETEKVTVKILTK